MIIATCSCAFPVHFGGRQSITLSLDSSWLMLCVTLCNIATMAAIGFCPHNHFLPALFFFGCVGRSRTLRLFLRHPSFIFAVNYLKRFMRAFVLCCISITRYVGLVVHNRGPLGPVLAAFLSLRRLHVSTYFAGFTKVAKLRNFSELNMHQISESFPS